MARDVMMSARSTPNLQQAAPQGRTAESKQQQQQQQQQQQHASIYSYLHTQSGLNFAPVVPHRQEDSPPPTPPVRDASSLKGVKYGPGHEKFPSWPVSAAADTPAAARPAPGGGSHRSKSWTDHTNYPKEKGLTYTRPYMKRTNPAFTQQLKTVLERCEKIPPETFEPRPDVLEDTQGRLYLPHLDREGNALGDMDYLAPSPPERDMEEYKATSSPLTQADLEEYARAYQPQQQPSYAQSEGYHSYVSSSDSTTTTPFLDRLRRDSEMTGRPIPGPQTPAWDESSERPGRDSVVTTSSGSASSSETLKWHGSLSDVSVASSSCTQLIAHSSKVQTPQRHHSESVLYLGSEARVQRNNHHNKLRLFPVNTYTVQPQEQPGPRTQQPLSPSSQPALSVAERISELERQQMLQTRYTYLDPDKRHRVSDPTLKAIQKKALLSFYERHHHANGQARAHQPWRSEPQLAQPVPRPQSPPPPQPPPRPRANQSPRRASSASDYAGGAWREMAANREAGASSDSGSSSMRENSRHQHSSSCGSLSSDLLGPLIIGPSISVDDWVPERPPKKPHLRAAFPPPVPDRLPSPDLPPPSPPPMLEDEVFATDEPLPPPPPELHPSDWSVAPGKTTNLESNCEIQQRFSDRLAEYTNLPSRSSEAPRHSESNPSSCQKLSLLRSQEPTTSVEAPLSPTRTSSSSSQPDVIPSVHRHSEYDSSSIFRHSDIAPHKHEAGTTPNNLPEICSVEQKSVESALQKHSENSSSSQRYTRYADQTRHPETSFTVQRYVENGATTGHQRLLESGHAVHRHLETSVQQKQQDNPHGIHRHLETSLQQKQQENPHAIHRHLETSAQQNQQENRHAVHRHLETSVQQKQQENPHPVHTNLEASTVQQKQQENPYSIHRNMETSAQQKQQENPHAVHRHLETSMHQKQQENPHAVHRHLETSMHQKQQENPHAVHRHLETSVHQKQQENPHAVHRHLETSVHQKQQENPHAVHRHLETSVHQKQQENPHAVHRHLETSVHQKQQENPHAVHRHLETSVHQKQQENPHAVHRHLETSVHQKQHENPHAVDRHLETSVHQKQENPHAVYRNMETLVHQKQQENSHAVHRHLETSMQQKQQENPYTVHKYLETSMQQKQQENHLSLLRQAPSETNHPSQKYMESCSSAVPRPTVQMLHENEAAPLNAQSHLTYLQQAETMSSSQKQSDNSSCRSLPQVHKREDSGDLQSSSQSTDNSSARHSEKDCSSRYAASSRGLESSSSPQQNGTENISENGIVTSRHVDALHQRYLEGGGTLNRRHLESNRSLDGSTSLYRYQDNVQSQKHYNHSSTSAYRSTGSMFSRPSGMRSTENLHQKTDGSRASDHWSNLKYSTQKLVVNGKLAAPLSERTVQNGGFTESVRMSDLTRLSKREFSSMPARARLQRLPLAVPNGDTISHVQVSPGSAPASPARSPAQAAPASPARSPGHAASTSPARLSSDGSSSPSSTVNVAAGSPAGSPTSNQQTTSKASYLASYRRDRDRGVPNFEGSYKRIMSPGGHETSMENSGTPVPECDRLSIPGEAEEVNHNHTEEAAKEEVVVVDRLTDSDVKDTDSSVVSCGVVETEIQCDLITETELPPPSPPPPPSPSPSPKVTESLQLVQRSEVVLRVNAATSDASSQTEAEGEKEVVDEVPVTAPPTTMLVRPKTQEEIECERLSLDLASHLSPSDKLQTLLVPDPEHKKPTDYVSGLFRLDVALRPRAAVFRTQTLSNGNGSSSAAPSDQTPAEDAAKDNNTNSPVSPLPANSKYFQISEPKAKFLNRYVQDMGQLNGLHDNKDLHRKKEELMARLSRKLEVLRGEQLVVMEEATVNDQLGESVAAQVSRVARPHELGKYRLHVEEVGKITSLLLGLSGRLARAENALMGLPLHHSERKILESKRDKLREQLEEAKKLKENIDRRSVSVSNILYKYFNSEEYADYDHFINMKAKLIMDSREIADKIKLGEEQLAALKETLCSNTAY